jgi:hypothetical protein
MSYYYRGRRSDYFLREPTKFSVLIRLFGPAVNEIKSAFLTLDPARLDQVMTAYGKLYGESAETYARKTYGMWKFSATKLSGKTMERLIELVPPHLPEDKRFALLETMLNHHRKTGVTREVKINIREPDKGIAEIKSALSSLTSNDSLANLPAAAMNAASWLYNDDTTALRAMVARSDIRRNEILRAAAKREIDLLMKTISTGQIKQATYSVEMPAGCLKVIAYSPSFLASLFGRA